MFYPIIPSTYVFQEGEARNIEQTADIFHQDSQSPFLPWIDNHLTSPLGRQSPSRWDYFLLHIGNVLINVGHKVRNESSYVDCSESDILQTDSSAGNA